MARSPTVDRSSSDWQMIPKPPISSSPVHSDALPPAATDSSSARPPISQHSTACSRSCRTAQISRFTSSPSCRPSLTRSAVPCKNQDDTSTSISCPRPCSRSSAAPATNSTACPHSPASVPTIPKLSMDSTPEKKPHSDSCCTCCSRDPDSTNAATPNNSVEISRQHQTRWKSTPAEQPAKPLDDVIKPPHQNQTQPRTQQTCAIPHTSCHSSANNPASPATLQNQTQQPAAAG